MKSLSRMLKHLPNARPPMPNRASSTHRLLFPITLAQRQATMPQSSQKLKTTTPGYRCFNLFPPSNVPKTFSKPSKSFFDPLTRELHVFSSRDNLRDNNRSARWPLFLHLVIVLDETCHITMELQTQKRTPCHK
jgi:hypothetical protein